MDVVFLISRILFASIFLGIGIAQSVDPEGMASEVRERGLPNAVGLVRFSGLAQVAGAVGVLLGVLGALAALGLGLFVLAVAVTMHPFWRFAGGERQMQQAHFMKNVGLAGGALATFVVYARASDLGLVLIDPLVGL